MNYGLWTKIRLRRGLRSTAATIDSAVKSVIEFRLPRGILGYNTKTAASLRCRSLGISLVVVANQLERADSVRRLTGMLKAAAGNDLSKLSQPHNHGQ